MASLWAELRRRNVVRVAIAYLVASWLVLQLTDVLVSLLILPDWVGRFVFLLLLIGLPVALFLAWAFEVTPDGIKKEEDVDHSVTHRTGRKLDFIIIGVLTVALAFFVLDKFVFEPDRDHTNDLQAEVVATDEHASIAVLPFVNMSPDPDQEYFSDGLSEEILNLLAKIPSLKVIGRTSSFAFKGVNTDLRDIGQTLGVTTVLEGSVRKSGDRIRVTAQLIDVSDGSHIWSDTYDRTMTDIFAIQDDVASAIIDALQIHVGTKPSRGRPTNNSEAYALFFQARVAINAKDLLVGEEILLKAIELDPNFAEAYELLAFCYWEQSGWLIPSAEGSRLMGEAAAKALAFDSDLAFAQALLGSAKDFSWLREIQGLERVLREEPGRTEVVEALGWNLQNVGYLQEALGVAERYVDRDPLLPAANYWLATALYSVGRTSESFAAWERAAQLDQIYAKMFLGAAYLVDKRDDLAIDYYEGWLQDQGFADTSWVRDLLTGARDPGTGQTYLDRRIPQLRASALAAGPSEMPDFVPDFYLYFGYVDRYFEQIFDIALESEWGDAQAAMWLGTVFRRTGFTAHPKYLEVAEASGYIELWEQRGPPDFCEKVSGDWICK